MNMSSDKTIHNRHSIRIPGYDYSIPDFYFITICTENKQCIFGHVRDGKMILNNIGKIVHNEIINIPKFHKHIVIHEFIVMPNHIHVILEIAPSVGAHVCAQNHIGGCAANGAQTCAPTTPPGFGNKISYLAQTIRGFKSGVTKQIGRSIWQRNYYEHIVRDDKDYDNIRGYIMTNPKMWDADVLFQKSIAEFNKKFE